MLNIIDINSNSSNLKFVETLKEDFRSQLSTTVKDGTVIIVSNFPAIGNMLSPIDYIVMLHIHKKDGNYLKIKVGGKSKYIYNAVLMIKNVNDDQIILVDNAALHSKEGELDYCELLTQSVFDFRGHCLPQENIWPYALYHVKAANVGKFYNNKVLVNYDLTAKYIIWALASQTHEKAPGYGVNSFGKDTEVLMDSESLIRFCSRLLEETNKKSKYGILTKKKIDELAKPSNVIDSILRNIGSSLSIITGKAGTGKTLALTKVINRYQRKRHNVRFLTFNNLLIFDIRQLLRNFPISDSKLSAMSIHSFFYKQAHTLGIQLLLSQERVIELMDVCNTRVEKLRKCYDLMFTDTAKCTVDILLQLALTDDLPKVDFEEFGAFAKFARGQDWKPFDEIKEMYLKLKKEILSKNVGSEVFVQDYYKVLELLYLAVTNTEQFYEEMKIKDRYELLAALYNTDKFVEQIDEENVTDYRSAMEIPLENLLDRVKMVERQVTWSKLMIIDEGQDFHVYEKELLFKVRKPENMIVASGGKEQLIRHSKVLDWGVSFNKKISHIPFALRNRSFRQKANIVGFVNAFGLKHGIQIKLESVGESLGLGKIIIDLRPKVGFIDPEILIGLRDNGKINGCSDYESLMFLVPSRGYTDKTIDSGFSVSDNDVVTSTQQSSGRKFKFKGELAEYGIMSWDGVSENKSALKIPFQTETRVIHYESCRGLEAWSCALMSLDSYFEHKRNSDEAAKHLADDIFLSENERRDKYAALWCLMSFTRPMDTLYIQLDSCSSEFSKTILSLASECNGVSILQ